jgi:hypothetical protein
LPSWNNMLEAYNKVIKQEIMREQPTITILLSLAVDWLHLNALNARSFGCKHNSAVGSTGSL